MGAEEDAWTREVDISWAIFWTLLCGLAALDLICLAPRSATAAAALPARTAIGHTVFWFVIGLCFNFVVFLVFGWDPAIAWFDGYILEYLLSVDNVFFFHVVFKAYGTPAGNVYKALFLGVLGAVVLRLAFYFVGAEFFRMAFIVQVFFGLVLIYSGYKTAASDDDDDDPRENWCVKCLTRTLPLTDSYDESGALFVKVSVGQAGGPAPEVLGAPEPDGALPGPGSSSTSRRAGVAVGRTVVGDKLKWRGTMLFLVVLVLQVVDLVFAVDSVTAKIAEYDSVFINFSSSAFAMLCLRSMYFVLTRLLKYFRFLKYGVALILVLIGVKLIISHWIGIPSVASLVTIVGVFAFSMVLSAAFPEEDYDKMDEPGGDATNGEAEFGQGQNEEEASRSLSGKDEAPELAFEGEGFGLDRESDESRELA